MKIIMTADCHQIDEMQIEQFLHPKKKFKHKTCFTGIESLLG
jgi:hypothetical protein